jgi:hypothetical protein
MLLNLDILKKFFLDVIEGKKTFEEASNWAQKRIQEDEIGELEYPSEDITKIFSGLTYLLGVDMLEYSGEYFHSIQNVKDKFNKLFNEND